MKQVIGQPVETMNQVRAWEKAKTRYMASGLCHTCAAQAVWGHQTHAGGWNDLHPPCAQCAPAVAGFPAPSTNPAWRKLRVGDVDRGTTAARDDRGHLTRQPCPSTDATESSAGSPGIGCGGCDETWTGLSAAHCAAPGCHRTFTSVSGFDAHRRDGHCLDPATARHHKTGNPLFVPAGRAWPGWSLPGRWEGPE